MGLVMIKCPTTGKPVFTRHRVTREQFRFASFPDASFRCPECGEVHTWTKKQAWLHKMDPAMARQELTGGLLKTDGPEARTRQGGDARVTR